jgi:hypothetical protein
MRRLTTLSPWTTLLIAAVGCGGGDKSPTGPTGPGGGGEDPGGPTAVEFELVRLGLAGLPADTQLEDCTPTRFYGGTIAIEPKTGEWQIDLQVHDDDGDWPYRDYGGSVGDDTEVLFDSQVSGVSYEGTVNADGTEIKIMYDWCFNGVPDVQLVFVR